MKLDENMMNSTKNWWRHQKITCQFVQLTITYITAKVYYQSCSGSGEKAMEVENP